MRKTKPRKGRAVTRWAVIDRDGSIDYCNIQDRKADLFWSAADGDRPARVRIEEVVQ